MRYFPFLAALFLASVAGAQVIYLPVKYQYNPPNPYYYGGTNPAIFRYADNPCTTEQDRIFIDCYRFQNARLYGATVADARNQAYQSVPRYYRKSDLLKQAVRLPDGTWVVPSR